MLRFDGRRLAGGSIFSMEFRVKVVLGDWRMLGREAAAVRQEVFVREQGVPVDLDMDQNDAEALHAVARGPEGLAVATARLLDDGHIGRLAVLRPWRRQGVGGLMLQTLLEVARERGLDRVRLSAQVHARGFYEAAGFQTYGEPYLDAGMAHIGMLRHLG